MTADCLINWRLDLLRQFCSYVAPINSYCWLVGCCQHAMGATQDVVKDCGILTMSLLKQVVCASVHLGLTSSSVAKSNMVERPQTAELQGTTIKLDHRVRDCDNATR